MKDDPIAQVLALLAVCHGLLAPLYPARQWDERMPDMPLMLVDQSDGDIRDAIIKLENYRRYIPHSR